jgi:RNA polymerase sigma-70 factor (ECF subfamily)
MPPANEAAAVPAADANGVTGIAAHRPAIWRYLRMLGASSDEADDLVQETMLVACRTPLATDAAAAGAFLRGVAQKQWLRTRRFWQRRREREIAAAVDELWLATCEADGGDERIERLRRCIESLAPRTREALELHYRDGEPWQRVAQQVGLLANGVKTLVQRARQALRACLERRNP